MIRPPMEKGRIMMGELIPQGNLFGVERLRLCRAWRNVFCVLDSGRRSLQPSQLSWRQPAVVREGRVAS